MLGLLLIYTHVLFPVKFNRKQAVSLKPPKFRRLLERAFMSNLNNSILSLQTCLSLHVFNSCVGTGKRNAEPDVIRQRGREATLRDRDLCDA